MTKSTNGLGDQPIENKYRDDMRALVGQLDKVFNGDSVGQERTTGFVLMIFPFNTEGGGRCNYVSNGANREDIVVLMNRHHGTFGQHGQVFIGHNGCDFDDPIRIGIQARHLEIDPHEVVVALQSPVSHDGIVAGAVNAATR